MDKKQVIKNIVGNSLQKIGYEYVDFPEWEGSGSYFYKKRITESIFTFIEFNFLPWIPAPGEIPDSSKSFRISLWRNNSDSPKLGFGISEYENWLNLPLSYLLWEVLKNKKYGKAYYVWEFRTQDDLEFQLKDALDVIIEYGIPWVEDLNTKNPYPSQ